MSVENIPVCMNDGGRMRVGTATVDDDGGLTISIPASELRRNQNLVSFHQLLRFFVSYEYLRPTPETTRDFRKFETS